MAGGRHFSVIPLDKFFKVFLPVNNDPPDTVKAASFTGVGCGPQTTVEAVYEPLVTELNKHCSPCRFYISPLDANRDQVDGADVRPVIWMKDHSLETPGGRTFRTSTAAARTSAAHRTSTLVTAFDWGRCELSCEVKNVTRDSLFDVDDDESMDERERQVIAYFKEQAARQHRTFVFQLFIFGHNAQFVRWDRCRAVVSEAFDYHKNPRLLAEFVWRYSRLDRTTGRGWDKNVSLADLADADLFKQKLNEVLRTPPTDKSSGTAKTIYRALRATFNI